MLWAYRTTRKSATQETPFALAYGTEAVAPVEVGLKSPRVEFASSEYNEEVLRLNLDLLEEKREQVLKRAEDYHRKTTRYHDRKVRPRSYKPGDLVLKKLLPARKDPMHGKLGPNWEGPYTHSPRMVNNSTIHPHSTRRDVTVHMKCNHVISCYVMLHATFINSG